MRKKSLDKIHSIMNKKEEDFAKAKEVIEEDSKERKKKREEVKRKFEHLHQKMQRDLLEIFEEYKSKQFFKYLYSSSESSEDNIEKELNPYIEITLLSESGRQATLAFEGKSHVGKITVKKEYTWIEDKKNSVNEHKVEEITDEFVEDTLEELCIIFFE